jgi:integrase/recombinase XerD
MGSYVRGVIDANYRQPNSASGMTEQAIGPFRRGMIVGVTIGRFAQKTEHDYAQRVKDSASDLKRSPYTTKPEDVRGFQLHLASSGAGVPKIDTRISVLRFFFKVTFQRRSTIDEPRKARVVLSPDQVARFLEAAPKTQSRRSALHTARCESPRLPD